MTKHRHPSHSNQIRKRKSIQIEKEEVKLSLLADMIPHIGNPLSILFTITRVSGKMELVFERFSGDFFGKIQTERFLFRCRTGKAKDWNKGYE